MDKRIVYFDMDGVLVDFDSGIRRLSEETLRQYADHLDDVPGIFGMMDPMPGAVEAVAEISRAYDVFILSTAPWDNPSGWTDKLEFVHRWFPEVFRKRLILSHRKDLLKGNFLIDDRDGNGASAFEGEWIHFGSGRFPDWDAVTEYLLSVSEAEEETRRQEYEKELGIVLKTLVKRINESFPDPKADGYPSSWKPVDLLAYEYGCRGRGFDEIDPMLGSELESLICKCSKGTSVDCINDVIGSLKDYLDQRSPLKKIEDFSYRHD